MTNRANRSVKLGNLILDTRNTRIPAAHQTPDQRALLHELVEHEDVAGLAKSIAQLGLFPNERMVVMRQNRRYTVLEGNRRLAALKLLQTPELAQKPAQVRFYRKLAREADAELPTVVDVVVVANRLEAAPIIAALHTRHPKRRWQTVQQAQFYRGMVEDGLMPAEVAAELGVTVGEVRSYLRSEKLYRVAQTLELPESVMKKLQDRRFPLTTLDRFLESTKGQAFLGIRLDEEHDFRGVVHPDRFRAVLTKVVTDVATVPGLTRMINKDADFEEYVSKAERDVPKTRIRGTFTPAQFLGAKPSTEQKQKVTKATTKRTRRRSKSVVPWGFKCTIQQPRVQALFSELKKLDVRTHPNSSAVMLRVLLDVALWNFYKANNLASAAVAYCTKKGNRRKPKPKWTPTLRELISYGTANAVFPDMTADGYKSVQMLLARDNNWIATLDTLNEYAHNPHVQPTEQEIHAVWERAEPMLTIILK
ncbi:MAG: hypothetical protein F4139_12155 [Gemmatimonadetes bacterium]|nr:hypothetical protein [Gemmatimonadota bacterium]MYH53672.1 hypothetical protein [Gemmatimonadota bacterium]MYK65097.1 hypothetical protein [Gemmatimonadota bacterium]